MAYVPVPKDLTKVKTKVMFNLTRRQLVCFTAGALVGVPLFLWLREPAGNSMAAMCMMLVMMPFFLLAMYEKHGQPLEKIVGTKDLTKVKTKVMFNLTKRQLICFTGGALIGVPLFFLLRKPTGNSVAAMCMMLVMLPFFMMAMYEKHGQPLEKIVGNILKVAVIRPKQRPYQTNNFYAVLKRQEMLDKEVYDIVHRNKKMAASDVRENRGKNCAAGKDKEKAVPRR